MIKAIVFDFDGVLINSNELKEKAYFAVLPASDHSLVRKIFADKNTVRTRSAVFRALLAAKGFGEKELDFEASRLSGLYNEFVQDGMEKLGFASSALETLKKLSPVYSLYINSYTPEDALLETVVRLGIGHFFKGVFGRKNLNSKKSEVLREIMEKEKAAPEEVLMVGDADSDFEAAEEVGCKFVGVANDYNGWSALTRRDKQKKEFPLVQNISEIPKFL